MRRQTDMLEFNESIGGGASVLRLMDLAAGGRPLYGQSREGFHIGFDKVQKWLNRIGPRAFRDPSSVWISLNVPHIR